MRTLSQHFTSSVINPLHDLVMRKCLTPSKAWKELALERAAELQAQINEKVAWHTANDTDEVKSKAVAELEDERVSTFQRVNPIHGGVPDSEARFRPKPNPQEKQ